MTTRTLALSDFLLARIADVEESMVILKRQMWRPDGGPIVQPVMAVLGADGSTLWNTDQVLAECEAKRRIVEEHPDYGGYGESCAVCAESDTDLVPWPCPTLKFLAAIYADHPDYQAEWREIYGLSRS